MSTALPAEVSVLILGGTKHLSRPLLKWLVDPSKDADRSGVKISHVRLADRYLLSNGTSTTYVEPDFWTALKDPRVEYRQVNLNVDSNLSKTYDHPNGNSYDMVFDFTGEGVGHPELPEELLMERTAKLAGSIAAESARRRVKSHIRDTITFLTVDVNAAPIKESDVVKPKTARAYWWYEAERAAASVPDLPLAITRSAEVVGPFVLYGSMPARFAFGFLYRHLKEPLKFLWGPDLRLHTIHVQDWCPAMWAIASWTASRSRSSADDLAGESLPPVRMKDKLQDTLREKVTSSCCSRTETPRAPLFHLVDDTDFDQGKLVNIIREAYGIEAGFVNPLVNAWARMNLQSVAEDINEKHIHAIEAIVKETGIQDVALSGWLDTELLANQSIALDGAKTKRVLGREPKVKVDRQRLEEVLDALRALNQFPPRDY